MTEATATCVCPGCAAARVALDAVTDQLAKTYEENARLRQQLLDEAVATARQLASAGRALDRAFRAARREG
jgi:hypothetical protein